MTQAIELESIRRLDIKPGEILVVTLPAGATAEYARQVRQQIAAAISPLVEVVVTSHGVDMQVLCPSNPA